MEPISIILSAVAAGAAAAVKDTASTAVKDAYAGLKALVQRRFGEDARSRMTLEGFEEDPAAWDRPFGKALEEAGAASDEEILEAARAVLREAEAEGVARGTYNLNISGGTQQGWAVGDRPSVTNSFGTPPS